MSLAGRFRPLASRLLGTLSGGKTTYTRVTQGVYDPASGSAPVTTTEKTVGVYFTRANGQTWGEQAITETSREALISAAELGFRPEAGDTVTENGQTLTVKRLQIVSGGTADVLYRVLVQAG